MQDLQKINHAFELVKCPLKNEACHYHKKKSTLHHDMCGKPIHLAYEGYALCQDCKMWAWVDFIVFFCNQSGHIASFQPQPTTDQRLLAIKAALEFIDELQPNWVSTWLSSEKTVERQWCKTFAGYIKLIESRIISQVKAEDDSQSKLSLRRSFH